MMNPIIGNKALEEAHPLGTWRTLPEKEKVRCHLNYALARLRSETSVPGKHPPRRYDLLRELASYAAGGNFPVHDRDERRRPREEERAPRFVDSNGTPCAVAHLLQRDGAGGRSVAASVAARESLSCEWIGDIASDPDVGPALREWCRRSGLSESDLALIQPSYPCYVPEEVRVQCRYYVARAWVVGLLCCFAAAARGLSPPAIWRSPLFCVMLYPSCYALHGLLVYVCEPWMSSFLGVPYQDEWGRRCW